MRNVMTVLLVAGAVSILVGAVRGEEAADTAKADPARALLEKKMSEVRLDGVPAYDAVDFVRDVTGAMICFDRPALAAVQIDPTQVPVTYHAKGGEKVGDVLAELAKQMVGDKEEKCVVDACGDVIVISTEGGAKAFARRHRAAMARAAKGGALKLDRKLPEVSFVGVGLGDVFDFLRDVTAVRIDVRWDDIQAAGVNRDTPVTLRAKGVNFIQVLRLILDDLGAKEPLDFEIQNGQLVISTAAKLNEAEEKGGQAVMTAAAARPGTRLILFPGLGADPRLFDAQRTGLPGVCVETPEWLEPISDGETIASYGRRMAGIIEPAGPRERLFVGGVSFGAIVALEVARHLPGVRAVFMMGGCRDTRAVAPFFRFACGLAPWIPIPLFKRVLAGGPVGLVMFESLRREHMRLYATMLNDASPRQVRWAAGALLNYRSPGDPPGVRVRLIHGQRDLIIHPKSVNPDYIVRRSKHLVSLSRPAEVNRILLKEMARDP